VIFCNVSMALMMDNEKLKANLMVSFHITASTCSFPFSAQLN
jgi:hypothetical protein